MPRSITLEDVGLFQMVCYNGGLSHPPGYPLFTMLCQGLLLGPDIYFGHALSAVFAALAVAVFFLVSMNLCGDRQVAWLASLGWSLTTTFWSQAIVIEVYSLAALLFMMNLLLVQWYVMRGEVRLLILAALMFGFQLANHWPLAVLSSPAMLAFVWPARDRLLQHVVRPSNIVGILLALTAGLSPYLYLITVKEPAFAIFGTIDSVPHLLRYVFRLDYTDASGAATPWDKVQFIGFVLYFTLTQLSLAGVPFILAGCLVSVSVLARSASVGLLLMFAGSTVLLVALLNFEYSDLYRAVVKPYPIIAVSAVAFWFALGVRAVGRLLGSRGIIVGPLLLLVIAATEFPRRDRSESSLVESFHRVLLSSLPPDAVLFSRGDNRTGPLGYLHYVKGERPDVMLLDYDNLVFPNRLASAYASDEQHFEAFSRFVERQTRPVFVTAPIISPRIDFGAYVQYNPGGGNGVIFDRALDNFADVMVDLYLNDLVTDDHERYFLFQLLGRFSQQYMAIALGNTGAQLPDYVHERIARLQQTFPGQLITLQYMVPQARDESDRNRLLEMAAIAEQAIPTYATRDSLALFYRLVGDIQNLPPDGPARAEEYYLMSIEQRPEAANQSACALAEMLEQGIAGESAREVLERFESPCGQ